MRIRKTIDLGNKRIITNSNAPMYGNHNKRVSKNAETAAAVKKLNEEHAIDMCEAMIEMNFRSFDWHIALTYSDESYADIDYERAMKDKRNFISKLRRRCKKIGIDVKYLTMTEQGVRSGKWHHHFVLPKEIPIDLMYECWPFGQIRILNVLYADGDFRGLAKYYVDKTKGGLKEDDRKKYERRYNFSLNCEKPKVTVETNLAESWLKVPRVPKGWMLVKDSLYNGIDSWGEYPFQKYVIIKIDEEKKNERNNRKVRKAETPEKDSHRRKAGRNKQVCKSGSKSADKLCKNRHKLN